MDTGALTSISILLIYQMLFLLSLILNGIVSSTKYWPHIWRNHTTTVRLLIIGDSVDRNSVLDWCANNDGNLCQPYRFCGPGGGFKFEGLSNFQIFHMPAFPF